MGITGRLQELSDLFARFTEQDRDRPLDFGGVRLYRRDTLTLPQHYECGPGFSLVIQGAKRLTAGTERFDYAAGQYLLTSLHLPVVTQVTVASPDAPHFCLFIPIDTEAMGELLARIGTPPGLDADGMRSVGVNPATLELLDAATRLVLLADRPQDIPALAPLFRQEILYHLLTGPDGPRLLHLALSTGHHAGRIPRAMAWMRTHFAETLRVETLAEHVGMSVSSLHHHFKAVTAMTPIQFQKQLRLHEARRLMLMENLDAGTAALRVGYQSPSQFSRDYSRLYGAPPARDVERVRQAAA